MEIQAISISTAMQITVSLVLVVLPFLHFLKKGFKHKWSRFPHIHHSGCHDEGGAGEADGRRVPQVPCGGRTLRSSHTRWAGGCKGYTFTGLSPIQPSECTFQPHSTHSHAITSSQFHFGSIIRIVLFSSGLNQIRSTEVHLS